MALNWQVVSTQLTVKMTVDGFHKHAGSCVGSSEEFGYNNSFSVTHWLGQFDVSS